jgi:hypothetical protein
MMKGIFCLCFCGLSIALYAQSALQTFTSPDGAFQFKHSAMLLPCTPKEGQVDVPQGCICDDHQGSAVIVCFTYPTLIDPRKVETLALHLSRDRHPRG